MSDTATQPLHARIRDQFHRRILTGDLNPGDRLPAEAQIMTQFHVSRGTVSRAMRDLEQLGILQRRRGAGTFVRRCESRDQLALRHVTMFAPWATSGEAIGFVQSAIHHELSRVCSQHDMLLSLQCVAAEGASLRDRMFNAARSLLARNIKTVLFCPVELPHEQMHVNREVVDLLVAGGANVVLMDRDIACHPDRSEFTWVSFDNHRGGAMLVKHLVQQGYRRIAFVGLSYESTAVSQRMGGYLDGLRACGLPVDDGLVFAPEVADEAFCDHLLTSAQPDAVICKDADMAAGMSRMLSARGVRIGAEIGLAGFDDAPVMSLLPVPVTVIRQPVEPFVSALYRVLQSFIEEDNHAFEGEQVVIRTELIPRASTSRG